MKNFNEMSDKEIFEEVKEIRNNQADLDSSYCVERLIELCQYLTKCGRRIPSLYEKLNNA